ncbi:MAG: CDP-alcohol phosphatidyltransferase family protein [Chloroflexota bacterium]
MSGSVVSPALRQRVRDLATPVARALGRLGLTPNALTVIGFLGTCAAAFAAASQAWLVAGILVLVFGIFDLFDGTLARATGRVTKFGAFLDSTFDRAGEAIVYVGIAIGCIAGGFDLGAVLAAAAMAAAFMVSYTRAKSESLGFTPGTGMANVGLAPREVRIAILAIGLLLAPTPLVRPMPVGPNGEICIDQCLQAIAGGMLTISLAIIAILATVTTMQRILHVRAQSREG